MGVSRDLEDLHCQSGDVDDYVSLASSRTRFRERLKKRAGIRIPAPRSRLTGFLLQMHKFDKRIRFYSYPWHEIE